VIPVRWHTLTGWGIFNGCQTRKPANRGKLLPSIAASQRSQKEGAAIPSSTPLSAPQFRGPVNNRARTPSSLVVRALSAIVWVRWERSDDATPQGAPVTFRKQSALLLIDRQRIGQSVSVRACGNRAPGGLIGIDGDAEPIIVAGHKCVDLIASYEHEQARFGPSRLRPRF
jgi:hypothetical protein